jgi:hypothetical protein
MYDQGAAVIVKRLAGPGAIAMRLVTCSNMATPLSSALRLKNRAIKLTVFPPVGINVVVIV